LTENKKKIGRRNKKKKMNSTLLQNAIGEDEDALGEEQDSGKCCEMNFKISKASTKKISVCRFLVWYCYFQFINLLFCASLVILLITVWKYMVIVFPIELKISVPEGIPIHIRWFSPSSSSSFSSSSSTSLSI